MATLQHLSIGGEDWFSFSGLYDQVVAKLPDPAHIVEVGCWKGRSVAHLAVAAHNTGKKIRVDAVDTWLGSDEHKDDECLSNDGLYRTFLENIATIRHLIQIVRLPSTVAAATYPDQSLDFVFLDAAHDYESVKADIAAWLPKVKPSGILAGHDYMCGWPGVDRAVAEAFNAVTFQDNSWMVILT